MKRTNLVLDDALLEAVKHIYEEKTYSGAVNRAMEDAVRTARKKDLVSMFGKVDWVGDLSEMRGDHLPSDPWLKASGAKSGK